MRCVRILGCRLLDYLYCTGYLGYLLHILYLFSNQYHIRQQRFRFHNFLVLRPCCQRLEVCLLLPHLFHIHLEHRNHRWYLNRVGHSQFLEFLHMSGGHKNLYNLGDFRAYSHCFHEFGTLRIYYHLMLGSGRRRLNCYRNYHRSVFR